MKCYLGLAVISLLLSLTAHAQFTGPTITGSRTTVEQARKAPVDTYVIVTGNIVSHLRENYYTFRDETGNIRVEIEPPVWKNREVGPETKVRLVAEVDRNAAGTIYLWVKSLEIVK
jgi:uncharacterized protein (TIGR00156 family)